MKKVHIILLGVFIVLGIIAIAIKVSSPEQGQEIQSFTATGNVVRNNPGLKPDTWFLIYEKPGQPGLSVELKFSQQNDTQIYQGQKVTVTGMLQDNIVSVSSITPVENPTETGTAIKLYYYNPKLDQGPGGAQCSKNGLVAVDRVIPKTAAPLQETIKILLRGELSEAEKTSGITTEFPLAGLSLKSASITNGVATLTFDDPQAKTGGGSCRVAILWAQIEATAKQFPTISSVKFLPEELFQP